MTDRPGDRLDAYRRKRDPRRTPEPVPARTPDAPPDRPGGAFVIQQHHARALHWDLRLERDGVLASWAVPRGVPRDPARNHLAVRTEDHPMEYLDFAGDIPRGEYGGGRMSIYDRGGYTTEKWRDDEVIVVLAGERVSGRYALFRTGGRDGRDWMIHRMDPYPQGWSPMPTGLLPMTATGSARLPAGPADWSYEVRWTGVRALVAVSGGRPAVTDAGGTDITSTYPEMRKLAEALAPTECLLDGVLVAFDGAGRIRREAPRRRRGGTASAPVQFLAFDLLWLDGVSTAQEPYARRRELLAELALAGPHWQTPPHFPGAGPEVRQASREQGMPGVIAKRLTSPYLAGQQTRDWREITHAGRPTRKPSGAVETSDRMEIGE